MRKTIAIVLILGLMILLLCLYSFFVSSRMWADIVRSNYSDEELLLYQLSGEGCWFHYDLNPRDGRCDFEWDISNRRVRNPEFHCRLKAAECLVLLKPEKSIVLPKLKKALSALPNRYNTGDGIIEYGALMRWAINEVENNYPGVSQYEFYARDDKH